MKKGESMQGEEITRLIMNPTRMRIIQYFMLHENATTTQIRHELEDVPKASLYRQMKMLEDANLIRVIKENRVRGAVEKVYELNKENPMGGTENSMKDALQIINSSLLSLMGEFNRYFTKADMDPVKDLLFLSTSTLLLSDEEFKKFTGEIGEVFNHVIQNKAGKDRKIRRITLISSPNEE
jgi:DNA-binding transcriptional ArsR family regulator